MQRILAVFLATAMAAAATPAWAQVAPPAQGGSGGPIFEQIAQKADVGEFIGLCAVIGGITVGGLAVLLFGGSALIATLRGDAPNAETIAEQLELLHERLDLIEARIGSGDAIAKA